MEEAYKKNLREVRQKSNVQIGKDLARYGNALSAEERNVEEFKTREEAKVQSSASKIREAFFSKNKVSAIFRAMGAAITARKEAEAGLKAPWVLAIAMAIACDCLDVVPIAGWIISWIFRPFLFVFLFRTGRWRVKLLRVIVLCFDLIPFVSLIPWTVISVVHAYRGAKKNFEERLREEQVTDELVTKNLQQQKSYTDDYLDYQQQVA